MISRKYYHIPPVSIMGQDKTEQVFAAVRTLVSTVTLLFYAYTQPTQIRAGVIYMVIATAILAASSATSMMADSANIRVLQHYCESVGCALFVAALLFTVIEFRRS